MIQTVNVVGHKIKVEILGGQNFCQKLQALAIIKIQISIHQSARSKVSVSFVKQWLLVTVNFIDLEVT